MKPIIINMNEMSDSTEVYETRPNPAFAGVIYCLCALILAAILWMCFFKIDVVVESSAMIKNTEETATITCITSGIVEEYDMEDGSFVEVGDLLFKIDSGESQLQLESCNAELAKVEQRLDILNAYLAELNGTEGLLDKYTENPYYEQYHNRLKIVESNCQSIGMETRGQQKQYESNIQNLEGAISEAKEEEKKLNQMLTAITCRVNSFKESELYYYSAVEDYLSSYQITESQYDMQISDLETIDNGSVEEYQNQRDKLQLEKEQVLSELEQKMVTEIEQSIKSLKSNQVELTASLKLAKIELDNLNNGQEALSEEQVITNEKAVIYSDLEIYENKKNEYENTIKTLSSNIEQSSVCAQSDGYLNLMQEYTVGDYIMSGTSVGTIVPVTGNTYRVQIFLENQDIGKVKEGSKVKYEILAYPSADYGSIEGTITKISKDLKMNEDTGSGYYLAEATIVLSENQNSVELIQGMAVQAKVVVEQKSVLTFLLEKIDLLN